MTAIISKLTLAEVSLVDDPANEHARVLILKRKDQPMPDESAEKAARICAKCGAPIPDGADKCAKCGAPWSEPKDEAEKAASEPQETNDMSKELEAALATETEKRVAAEKMVETLKAKVAEYENQPSEVEKRAWDALPEAVRKRVADAEGEVRKLREEREIGDEVRKLGDYKHLSFDSAVMAKSLRALRAVAPDAADAIHATLAAASAAAEPLFKEKGKGGANTTATRPAIDEINALVAEAVSKSGGDKTAALNAVFNEKPELFERYRRESVVTSGRESEE